MAVISCPECGQNVSTLAEACPHCGVRLLNGALVSPNINPYIQDNQLQEQDNAINMQSRIMLDQEKMRLENEIFEIDSLIQSDTKSRGSYMTRHAIFLTLGCLALFAFFCLAKTAPVLVYVSILIPAIIVFAVLDSISAHKANNLKRRIENNQRLLERKKEEYQNWYQNYYLTMYNQL